MVRSATEHRLSDSMLAVLVLLAAMLGPRLPFAGTLGYMQHLWFARIERFIEALANARLADTFQGPHPGVTLMWILGAAVEIRRWTVGPLGALDRLWTLEVAQMLWATAVVILLYFSLRRTLVVYGSGRRAAHWSALLAAVLVALDPMFLTMTQVMTLDGPLAVHVTLALCLFLTASRTGHRLDYALAGLATALAVLTKMSALIFVLGMGMCLLVRIWRRVPEPSGSRRAGWAPAATFAAALLIAVFVCWPALWVAPLASARRIAMTDAQADQVRSGDLGGLLANRDQQAGLDAILDVVLHPHRPGNARVVYGRTTTAGLYYPAVVFFKTPPMTLLLSVIGIALVFLRWGAPPDPFLRLVAHLTTWNALYFICLSVVAKKTWRYLVTFEVLLEICAGLTLSWLVIRVARRYGRTWALALLAPVAVQLGQTLTYAPHFITYHDPMVASRAKVDEYLMLYWGEGAGETARYMQSHAQAQPVRFISENWDLANLLRIMLGEPDLVSQPAEAEFLVISYRDVLLQTLSRPARYYWSSQTPEYVASINGVPYVWVYRLEK